MYKPLISLSVSHNDGNPTNRIRSHKSRRIFAFIQADNFQNCLFSLCVNYGHGFTNTGTYPTKTKLIQALHAFLE